MKQVWLDQLWGAVKSTIGVNLILSLEEEPDSEFAMALSTSSNVSTALGFVETAVDETVKSVTRDVTEAVGSTIEGAASRLDDAAALKADSEKRAAQLVSTALSPLKEAKNVCLLKSDGTYEEITSAWRHMQSSVATMPSTTVESWMASYANLLSRQGGVAVKVGDAAPAEIEGVVRRSAWEAKMRTIDEMNREVAALAGYDGVQVSAHSQCAEDHLPYQGRVYSITEFDLINESLARPIGRGVMNCRHSLTYCDKNRSSAYDDDVLAQYEEDSTKSVTYTGRSGKELTSSAYEASQYLRGCESNIRSLKQKSNLLTAAGADTTKVKSQIKQATKHYRGLCEELGENYHSSRISVYMLK